MTFRFSPKILIGHPSDRLLNIAWDIDNGAQTSNKNNYIVTLDTGYHVIKAIAKTKMGFSASYEKIITVVDNKSPYCTLDYSSPIGVKTIIFNAQCKDDDGIIKSVIWLVNDKPTSNSNKDKYIFKYQPVGSGNVSVKIKVMDDAKTIGESQVTVAY